MKIFQQEKDTKLFIFNEFLFIIEQGITDEVSQETFNFFLIGLQSSIIPFSEIFGEFGNEQIQEL